AVLADAGERYPVVDLADLVECRARVLGDEQHAVRVLQPHHRLAAGDPLVREVRQVLDPLLGWHVRHEAHEPPPTTRSQALRTSSAPTLSAPLAVPTTTGGKIPPSGPGPPV